MVNVSIQKTITSLKCKRKQQTTFFTENLLTMKVFDCLVQTLETTQRLYKDGKAFESL